MEPALILVVDWSKSVYCPLLGAFDSHSCASRSILGASSDAPVTVTQDVSSLNVSVTFKMAIRKKIGSPIYFEHFK